MPSTWTIQKRRLLVCLLVVFAIGIAAERYRQYLSTNVGDVLVQRTDAQIALTIDGDSFTDWDRPATLRSGSHQFHAAWRGGRVETTINVKRGDKAPLNRVDYSLHNGQLQVFHNSHLVDVVPRPASEAFTIQTASGEFWHTADDGEIAIRHFHEPDDAEPFTVHWLRPDHSEAFIESSEDRFVINTSGPLDVSQGFLRLSDENDWPSIFKIDRVKANESWIKFTTGRYFVDVDADPKRVRTTHYELLASPHFLKPAGDSVATHLVPPTPPVPVSKTASDPSVRRLKGHTNVIRAVVFTPDGKHIVSGSTDGTIRLWNVQSGKQVDTIQTHRPVMSLAISSDGKTLAGGLTDAVVKIWKLEHDPVIAHRDQRILSRDHPGRLMPQFNPCDVLSIAFSPDDTKVAAGGNRDEHTRIWNLLAPDERCKSSTLNGPVTSLVWARSGERVLLCEEDGRSLRWWPDSNDNAAKRPHDARSGKLLIRSGDDPLVVVGAEVLDAESFEVVHTFQQRSGVRTMSAQLLRNQNLLVTADVIVNVIHELEPDEFVSVWDLKTGESVAVLRDHVGQAGNIAISQNGEYVAYGNGIDDTNVTDTQKPTGDYDLRVWRITNDEQ